MSNCEVIEIEGLFPNIEFLDDHPGIFPNLSGHELSSHAITPDDAVVITGEYFELTDETTGPIFDPACGSYGFGTALRSRNHDLRFDGSDSSMRLVYLARRRSQRLTNQGFGLGSIVLADLCDLPGNPHLMPNQNNLKSSKLMTSLPFKIFEAKDPVTQEFDPGLIDPIYAWAIGELISDTGIFVLDGGRSVVRGKEKVPIADLQEAYFTTHGFTKIDQLEFRTSRKLSRFDSSFVSTAYRKTTSTSCLPILEETHLKTAP